MGGYTKTLLSKLSQVGVTRFTHLALLSVMTLIPVYQRYYNSILLLLVLMWALVIPQRLIATVTVIGMSSFLYEFAFTQHPSLQLSAKPSANWFILAAGPMLLMYLYRFKASGQPDPIRKAMEKLP
jgi:hypothetical protein